MILAPVCGVIFLVIVMVCTGLYLAKRKKAGNTETGVEIPMMSTSATSASHATQPGQDEGLPQPAGNQFPDPLPPVGSTPDSRSRVVSSPNPNPEESPPPYPEEESVPQYLPPGELYPWQQGSNGAYSPECQ